MAQQDYCEIILNAVSQIVTAETAARQNKGMIACRVKDITERNLGRYSVNYKGDTFLACGEATDYEIDDEVYVLRAENTGSQLSVIVGRKLREDEFPIQINDPLTKMMRLKEWRPTSASGVYEVTPSAPYDTIGLSFDAIGEFTITLKVVNTVGRTYTYELDETNFLFSSSFDIALTQRCTIDISRTGTPLRVELSTTGDLTNFIVDFGYNITNKLESDKALKLYTEGEQKYYTDSFGNLKENNTINLYLDWLYLDENAEIKSLTHINYLENKPLGFEVNWYKQTEGVDGDFYSGPGWTKIIIEDNTQDPDYRVYYIEKDNLFALSGYYNALFSGDLEQTAIKAVITYTPIGATSVETIVSNELIFENIQDESLEYITRGSIELSDGSNAVYPFWALNGFLKDQNDVYKEREFNFSYSTGLGVEALYKNIASVTWYIPKANMYYFSKERISSTAIQSLEGEYAVLTIIPFETAVAKDSQGKPLSGDDLYKGALKEIFRADYKLMERYIANRISNKVICEINFKDETETWKQERDLYFSKAGLDGTGSQILIWLTDKNGNLARNVQFGEGNTYTVNTLFVDENGESLPDLSPLSVTVQHGMSSEKGQGKYEDGIYTPPSNPLGYNVEYPTYCDILKVVYQIEPEKQESTQEIVYEWDGSVGAIVETKPEIITTVKPATTYTEYYPISYALWADYGYEGPTYITYDSSGGNPTYDNTSLAIWEDNKRFEGRSDVVWWLQYQLAETQYIDAIPKLKPKVGGQTGAFLEAPSEKDKSVKLYPANYYENSIDYVVSIIIYEKKVMGTYTEYKPWYIQPLVIRQARHFSTILDNWDGQFKIDAENGYVLSSALVAGNKNEKNEFSGVIAGTLNTMMNLEVPVVSPYPLDNNGKPITDENGKNIEEDTIVYKTNRIYRENQTGILGYKDGIQTYGFLDNGTAFIGPSGQGQILFDGTEGKIKSGGNFIKARQDNKTGVITTEGTGMIIDFTYGGIYAPNFILDPLGNASFAGRISADWGTVGGYNIASRMLYTKVNENKYMALLSPSYKAAKYEDNPANYGEDTAKERDNWYYWKKIDENNGQYEEYPGIPHIENQAGPGLIIENNKRRLRAFFESSSFYPQFMVDQYEIEADKKEKILSSISIGYDKETDQHRPGLFGESNYGNIKMLVPGDQEITSTLYYGPFEEGTDNKAEGRYPVASLEVKSIGAFQNFTNYKKRITGITEYIDFDSDIYLGNSMLALTTTKYSTFLSSIGFVFGSKEFIKDFNPVKGGFKDKLPDNQYFFNINTPQNRKEVNGWTINSAGLAYLKTGPTTGSRFQVEQQSLLFESYKSAAAVTSKFKINTSNDVFLQAEHNNQEVLAVKASKDGKSVFNIQTDDASIAGLHIWSETTKEQKSIPTTYSLPRVSSKFDQITFDDGSGGAAAPDDDAGTSGSGTSSTTTTKTIYISTKAKDRTVPSTDKIVFNVPVEFANAEVGNVAPMFTNTEGVIFKTQEKWMQIKGDILTGGATKDTKSFELYSGGNGLIFYYQPLSVDASTTENATYVNKKGIAINIGTGENKDTYYMVARNDMNSGIQALYKSAFINLYNTTLSFFTNNKDTAANFVLKSDGTGSLKLNTLTLNGIQLTKTGPFNVWGGAYALNIDQSLQVTNYIGAKEIWVSDDFKINGTSIADIYLKKKLLRLDDNYKNIIGFDQTYYVNGGDSSGTYTNYYTLSNYGTASKVTINADKLTYYYLGDYNKNDTIVTVKATNISYYKEGLEYSGEASDTKTISGTATTTITNYKTITCGNTVTCTGICSCGEEVTCTGTCTDWWYWTNGTSDLEIPWQAQVKAIADSSFAIGDTDISTTIQIEQL